jgi:hypothetical protein
MAKQGETGTTQTPTTSPVLNTGVLILYLLIIGVLGAALWASLASGKTDTTFSSGIITAITTIAGFAVGINASPSTPRK